MLFYMQLHIYPNSKRVSFKKKSVETVQLQKIRCTINHSNVVKITATTGRRVYNKLISPPLSPTACCPDVVLYCNGIKCDQVNST